MDHPFQHTSSENQPSKPRRKAMERQCRYRMGDGCPCDDLIECRVPDGILLAQMGQRIRYLQERFKLLVERCK